MQLLLCFIFMLAKLPLVKLSIGSDHRSQKSVKSGAVGEVGSGAEPPHVLVPKTLLPMYLTIPVTSATLRSTMKQDRLNNYLLVYCHKSITDTLDTVKIACANEQRKWHFEKFEEGCAYV